MSKKAQGLSINVIIVAAIALIVLVVLVAIFTGRLGIFTQKVAEVGKTCDEYTGTIDDETVSGEWLLEPCGAGYKGIVAATDADEHPGEYCCLRTE